MLSNFDFCMGFSQQCLFVLKSLETLLISTDEMYYKNNLKAPGTLLHRSNVTSNTIGLLTIRYFLCSGCTAACPSGLLAATLRVYSLDCFFICAAAEQEKYCPWTWSLTRCQVSWSDAIILWDVFVETNKDLWIDKGTYFSLCSCACLVSIISV